jgi:hypothetical protein
VVAPLILLLFAGGWADFPDPPVAKKARPARTTARKETLEEFQALLDRWQKERLEFAREQHLQSKAEDRVELSRAGQSAEAPAVKVEVKQRGGAKGRGKVLEFAPKSKLEAELEEAEVAAEARRAECAKNPGTCAAQKAQREKTEAANDAFDDAVEAGFEKRRAQIEAEAARMQKELDAAKQREATRQAKKLGGTVDGEGNFADDDLKAEPDPRKSF